MLETIFDNAFFSSVALTLLHFLWQGLAIAVVLKLLLILTPKEYSRLRYGYSSAAMLSMLIVPVVTFFIIYQPASIIANEATNSASPSLLVLPFRHNQTFYQDFMGLLPYITMVWFACIFALSSKLIWQIHKVHQLPKQGFAPYDKSLNERFEQLIDKIDLTIKPQLILSLTTQIPMAIGWLKPVVLIPASMVSSLTPAQLDMLILHELGHIRRHDYLVNILQSLIEILLFFHPAVYWVSKQMRVEREYCCDDIAVKHCGNPLAYAHTLADTASLFYKHSRFHSIPSMAMAAAGGDLKERVLRLVSDTDCTKSIDSSKWVAALFVIAGIFISFSHQLSKVPQYNVMSKNPAPDMPVEKRQQATIASAIKTKQTPTEQPIVESEKLVLVPESQITNNIVEQPKPAPAAIIKPVEQPNIVESNFVATPKQKQVQPVLLAETPIVNDSLAAFESNITQQVNPYSADLESLSQPISPVESIPTLTRNELEPTIQLSYQEPKLLDSTQPKYPISAKRKGIEIELLVSFDIGTDGRVNDIQIENKRKASYFKNSIRNALLEWKFEPASENGQAVESKVEKIFAFTIK